ncbi:PilZ domain-containing protein [Qipengyuania sp.]|uniref:PilZ domain-containing protein n=1 Tax=Qipengyuania sp. TaxID=2004515 RepID=UPI0035C853F3
MLSAAYTLPETRADCGRTEVRTNMFVLAMLVAEGVSNKVKIRNMSPSGALIEGPLLPRPGNAIKLCRAETTLTGHVVWSVGKHAGLRFRERAVVSDWLPATNGGQRAVDQAVALAKAEKDAGLLPSSSAPLPSSAISAADVMAIAAAVDQLADELASDPAVIAKFMNKLQILDIAGQTLKKFASQ